MKTYTREDLAAVWWSSLTDMERSTAVDRARDRLGREPSIREVFDLVQAGRIPGAGKG